MRAAAVLLEMDAEAAGRASECLRDLAIGLLELDQKIALAGGVGARRLRRQRLSAVGDRGQWLIIDGNECCGVFGNVARLRDHDRHRFADERDFVLGERKRRDVGWKIRRAELQRQPLLREKRRKIREREYRMNACAAARGAGVDPADGCVSVRAAYEGRLEHAGKRKIGGETGFTDEQRAILEPLDRVTDAFGVLHALADSDANRIAEARPGNGCLSQKTTMRNRVYPDSAHFSCASRINATCAIPLSARPIRQI